MSTYSDHEKLTEPAYYGSTRVKINIGETQEIDRDDPRAVGESLDSYVERCWLMLGQAIDRIDVLESDNYNLEQQVQSLTEEVDAMRAVFNELEIKVA